MSPVSRRLLTSLFCISGNAIAAVIEDMAVHEHIVDVYPSSFIAWKHIMASTCVANYICLSGLMSQNFVEPPTDIADRDKSSVFLSMYCPRSRVGGSM